MGREEEEKRGTDGGGPGREVKVERGREKGKEVGRREGKVEGCMLEGREGHEETARPVT